MPMRKAILYSALLHLAVVVVAWIGLPYTMTLPVDPVQIIAVEIADASETPERKAPQPKAAKPATPEEPPAPPPAPKQPDTPAPPPPPKPVEPEPESVPVPSPDATAAPETKPVDLPARPKPKPVPPKEDDFASVLKTVDLLESDAPAPKKPADKKPTGSLVDDLAAVLDTPDTPSDRQTQLAPTLGSRLTVSEKDAIARQLRECWNVSVGARNPEELLVEVKLQLRRDGSLVRADVVDKARMTSDPFFRSAAEAALRALKNPKCVPLKLPPEKYEEWKVMTFVFDPSVMVGQ